MGTSLQARAMQRAVDLLGGVPQLAGRLGMSRAVLKAYLDDRLAMPQALFLRIVDIITDDRVVACSERQARTGQMERK